MAGVRARLERDTLLEAPISAKSDDVVVDDGVAVGVVFGSSGLSDNAILWTMLVFQLSFNASVRH